jgi:NADH-quinone oxidoreductase E subunit
MTCENHAQCCGGSEEIKTVPLEKLDEILESYKNTKGALIPILQKAQHVYGYLPKEVIVHIAKKTATPVSQVYGVTTFYSQFHLNPRGRNIIRVCQGTACHVRGAKSIIAAIEDKLKIKAGQTTEDLAFTLETVACIGACGLAPVLMVNEDTHGRLTTSDIAGILDRYS